MNRRTPNQIVAANIAAAQSAAGVQLDPTIASTADSELTFGDLLNIGGALRVSPALFLAGVRSA